MIALRALLAGLFLTAIAPLASAQGIEENGGVIILLHSNLRFVSGQGPCETLYVVAPDDEVQTVEYRLSSEANIMAVQLSGMDVVMRLKTLDEDRLEGRVLGTNQRVVVVSQSYAERTWRLGD